MTQVAYLAFRDHNVLPSLFFSMNEGERLILEAFIQHECDERAKAVESMKGD